MTTSDVQVGDEVKNGRSQKWGRVVRLEHVPSGAVLSLCVKRHLGDTGLLSNDTTWWPAASIVGVERKR